MDFVSNTFFPELHDVQAAQVRRTELGEAVAGLRRVTHGREHDRVDALEQLLNEALR